MIYYSENLSRVYAGDCRYMTDIEDNSVHCVVTSPPYFGLRRYKGLEDLIFDGGAWRGQLGSELTIEMFIAHLVEVFREVKRVLRPDGVCWVNIGDSMAGSGQGKGSDHGISVLSDDEIGEVRKPTDGLKPLDACLIPFRLALALQADGWWFGKRSFGIKTIQCRNR